MNLPVVDAPADTGEQKPPRWVVELILDLCGYTEAIDLTRLTLAMPDAGSGAFLLPTLERLVAARPAGRPWADLMPCIRGWGIPDRRLAGLRWAAAGVLTAAGCPSDTGEELCRAWLAAASPSSDAAAERWADVVVGGPVNADCHEHSLALLAEGGTVGFVGPDHWQHDEAGRRLRAKIATRGFAVDAVITLPANTPRGPLPANAPSRPVPATASTITIIRRGPQEDAVVAHLRPQFGPADTEALLDWIDFGSRRLSTPAVTATRLDHWPHSSAPWPSTDP